MKTLLCLWAAALVLALGACRTATVDTEDGGARPEVRYYVIADT